jgi:hypothetical protein
VRKGFVLFVMLLQGAVSAFGADSDKGRAAWVAGDYATALRELVPLAKRGDAASQNTLGAMYAQGQGVQRDDKEAARLFRLAAEQGSVKAQHNLGWAYRLGRGVPKDYKEALKWHHLAADQGFAPSLLEIGLMIRNGWGVPQNFYSARSWIERAAEKGDLDAQKILEEDRQELQRRIQEKAAEKSPGAAIANAARAEVNKCQSDARDRLAAGRPLVCKKSQQVNLNNGSLIRIVSCTAKVDAVDICSVEINRGNCKAARLPGDDIAGALAAGIEQFDSALNNRESVAPVVHLKFGETVQWSPTCSDVLEMRFRTSLGTFTTGWDQ